MLICLLLNLDQIFRYEIEQYDQLYKKVPTNFIEMNNIKRGRISIYIFQQDGTPFNLVRPVRFIILSYNF